MSDIDVSELKTIGDLMDAMDAIFKDRDAEAAAQFMADYRDESEHADVNIGYLTGYYGQDTMRAMQEFFGVSHPIFGRSVPTPEEAFAAGVAMAQEPKP